MFYFRYVRNANAFKRQSLDVTKATAALIDRTGGDTSVYLVSGNAEAQRVAMLFSMWIKQQPEQLDYLLIPQTWLLDCGLAAPPVPNENIPHPWLRERHCELHGLTEQSCNLLIRKFQDFDGAATERLQQRRIAELAKTELEADPSNAAKDLIEGKQRWIDWLAKIT
jgi:hypothetical protein